MPSIPDIPDYQIGADDFLGEGAYGRVWRAVFKGDQERAVKVFKPRAIQEMLFEGEYDKLRQLDEHPGIVTLYDRGRTAASEPYFVMRLLAEKRGDRWLGRTLGSRLEKDSGKSPDAVMRWRWTKQVAEAVAFMHERDIVHCDLKPSNVLLSSAENPDAVVSDFGQSRSSSLRELPAPGSLAFASPEQLENPERSNPRWDVYGFAATAYYLWQERPPRPIQATDTGDIGDLQTLTEVVGPDEELAKMIAQLRGQQEVDLSDSGTAMPEGLGELLQRCLSLDPGERPADMGAVLAELNAIDARRSGAGLPKWLLPTLGVVLTATIAIGGLMLSKHRQQIAQENERKRQEAIAAAIVAKREDLHEQLRNATENDDAAARHELALRLLADEPENPELWLARFESLAAMGDWQRLRASFSDGPPAAMAAPVLLPVRARLAEAEENFAEEKELWMELAGRTDVDPELRRSAFREWCSDLRNAKQWSQLSDASGDWLTWEAVIEPLLFRVDASLQLRDFARARVDLDAARDLDATHDRVREMTPVVERGERLAERLVALDAAVQADRRAPQPLMARALAFLKEGFHELAKPDLEAAHRLIPDSAAVEILREITGFLSTGQRSKDSRVAVPGNRWNTYDMQHLEAFEFDAPLLMELLDLEVQQTGTGGGSTDGDLQQQVNRLGELVQHRMAIDLAEIWARPDNASATRWTSLLGACFRGQRWADGEQYALEATERFSENNVMWFFLGAFRARQDDHRGAVAAFDRSLELFDDTNARDWRATSLEKLKQ